VKAECSGAPVAECEMVFVWTTLEDTELDEQRRRLREFWLRDIPPEP
jgi:hypothetical protein